MPLLEQAFKRYRLYWLRENGCDSGTPVGLDDLDVSIRERVSELTGGESTGDDVVPLHLPFVDSREWRGRSQVLRTLDFVKDGDAIRGVWASRLGPLRDMAASLSATHPAWREAARESDPRYFHAWRRVSAGLQTSLRSWIREEFFADPRRFEDRDVAYAVLIYSVSRPFPGRPRTDFTFDVADPRTLPIALRMIGCATQAALATAEARLNERGDTTLAHRYAPIWYQDVINRVSEKPARLLGLLGDEAMLINAVIQLGAGRSLSGVKPFARAASLSMRSTFGVDMRAVALKALEETTNLLMEARTKNAGATSRSGRAASRPSFSAPGTSGRCTLGSAASR